MTAVDPIIVHDLLFRLQRKRRLILLTKGVAAENAGPGVNFVEESVLELLEGGRDLNVLELARSVGVERSWMSRVVTNLESRKLLNSYVPDSDKRSKRVQITKSGRQALIELGAFAGEIMQEALRSLNQKQVHELARLISRFADGLGVEPIKAAPTAHPVYVQLGRISRGLGVYSDNIAGGGIPVTQLQVFYLLEEQGQRETTVKDIIGALPFDVSTVSRTIQAFRESGYVDTRVSKHDKRSSPVVLSTAGRKFLNQYRTFARARFAEGLRGFTSADLNTFAQILQEAVTDMPVIERASTSAAVLYDRVRTQEDKAWIAEALGVNVGKRMSKNVREEFMLRINNQPKGALITYRDKKDGSLVRVVSASEVSDERQFLHFVKHCLGRREESL